MYDLGEQFKIDYELAKTNPKSIIKGNKYRITILTESLIRFEYSQTGIFEDRPTELVRYRNLAVPHFELKDDKKALTITTSYFKIRYIKEKPFYGGKLNPTANLKVNVNKTEKFWYYGHPEVRNYGAPFMVENNKLKFKKGLYSLDGFVCIDDSKSPILLENGTFEERNQKQIDVYVFVYNKEFSTCLKDYYSITGYPALIPRYALGNWWSKNDIYDDKSLQKLIIDFEKNQIPLSVILLDRKWHINSYQKKEDLKTGFTFNPNYFPNPAVTVKYMHSKGIRCGVNINPEEGLYPIDEYYDEARKYLRADKNGVIPFNILDPKFIDVYFKLYIHPLDALGVDFYFIDYCNRKDLQELSFLKHYHFLDAKRSIRKRALITGYNTSVASHRYPILYSGKSVVSWESLKQIPYYNSNASNIGVSFWAHDIGGYYKGIEDNELYIRFVQLGIFSPIFKFGADSGKYYKREPWRWGIKTYSIVKDYLNLRQKLIPYLYSEAYKYHKFGTPIVQPIYYTVPYIYDDVIYKNEYYFGSEFFVAPIVNKKDYVMNRAIHKFYMPEGMWYDFVTGKKFPGDKYYVSFFKEEDYPVFVKAGAIIPLGYNDNLNDTNPPKNMEINIFPGKSNTYTLYEDDGISNLYDMGYYLTSSIEYNYMPNNFTVIIRALDGKSSIVPDERNYKIVFRNTKMADEVIVYQNRNRLPSISYVDGPNFVVEVKNVKTVSQLTVNCKGKDIEIDAVRLINNDIEDILSDLQIKTEIKEKVDAILFSKKTIKEKRIAIRKLNKYGLERKFITLFLKLLEYIDQI